MAIGREIMIVEDETMIGFDLADLLCDAGYAVSGPWVSADEALEALSATDVSLAILDVNLGEGQTSRRIAEQLTRDGTPVVFVSGYGIAGSEVLRDFPGATRISKPWDPIELLGVVKQFVRPVPEAVPAA